jgi:hypothetical protein
MMIVEISYEKRVDNRRSPTYITASIKVSRLQPGLLWQHIVLIVSLISWILGGFEWVHRTVNIARNTVGSRTQLRHSSFLRLHGQFLVCVETDDGWRLLSAAVSCRVWRCQGTS